MRHAGSGVVRARLGVRRAESAGMETIFSNPSVTAVSPVDRQAAIAQLNELLRGEIAAVETYKIAIDRMRSYADLGDLQANLTSHEIRVGKLQNRVRDFGGEVSEGSGAWGAFAKLVEGSAAMLSDSAAIGALEEGEDRGLKQYREATTLDPAVKQLVDIELLPAQLQTHAMMSQLKKREQKD